MVILSGTRKLFHILLFTIGITNLVQAQDDPTFRFTGVVFDADSLAPLFPVQYVLNDSMGGINFPDGAFAIRVKRGDRIQFRYVGFRSLDLIVSDTLDHPEYLVGIFMVRDTIFIEEVVIVPRFRSLRHEITTLGTDPDPEILNAKRNLQISAYQGLRNQPNEMDAEMNQAMVQQRYIQKAMDMGLISSDEILPITALLPLAYYMIKKIRETEESLPDITPMDISRIRELYKREGSRMVQDTIPGL
jgi:hypothetical protein